MMEQKMNPEIEYKVSTHPSKFYAWQEKKGTVGSIKLFVSTIYKEAVSYSEETFVSRSFVRLLIFYTLVERFCIERAFQKIRMHQRCKPECKIAPYAMYAFEHLYSDLFSE